MDKLMEDGAVWNGPEVSRSYPPDKSIQLIRPDEVGVRSVPYEVRLTYRDHNGRITKRESFRAVEKIGADFPDPACTPAATCLKGSQ